MSLDRAIARARRAYHGIEPDPLLAEHITSRLTDRGRTPAGYRWIPVGVAATALLAIVLVLRSPPDRPPAPQRLAFSLPSMPGTLRAPPGMRLKSPGLHRTVALPVLPPTPARDKPKPRTDPGDSASTRI